MMRTWLRRMERRPCRSSISPRRPIASPPARMPPPHREDRGGFRVGGPAEDKPLCAKIAGFSLHAATPCRADDRYRLARLCRYVARPAFADDQLHWDGAECEAARDGSPASAGIHAPQARLPHARGCRRGRFDGQPGSACAPAGLALGGSARIAAAPRWSPSRRSSPATPSTASSPPSASSPAHPRPERGAPPGRPSPPAMPSGGRPVAPITASDPSLTIRHHPDRPETDTSPAPPRRTSPLRAKSHRVCFSYRAAAPPTSPYSAASAS